MDHQQQETLKRHNENLNNDEFDVTWGGKRSRYIYNYVLKSPDSINDNDSDTDSINSTQTKSTVEAVSDEDTLSCGSNCSCINQNQTQEFDVCSLSSWNIDSNSTDSSTILPYEVSQNVLCCNNTSPDTDSERNKDTDNQLTTIKTNFPPPACFKTCLQCRKENPNPYFQFCFTCFKYRIEFFGNKPKKPQSIKKLNIFLHNKVSNLPKGKLTNATNSQQSNLLDKSSLYLFQKENKSNNDNQNKCNYCFNDLKNGIINHGKIGHIVDCYYCAKRQWKISNKCPICNTRIKFVTKMT